MNRIAALVLLALAAPLAAAPLDKSQIPADVKWVVHADVEGFFASKMGTAVLDEARKQGLDAILGAVQAMFSFDPTKDLKSVAVFGTGFKDTQAVVLIRARVDRDKMLKILKANPGFQESKYGDHAVYSWQDKAKEDKDDKDAKSEKEKGNKVELAMSPKCGCFWGEDVALIAQDMDALKHAVDVLDKKADSLAKEGVAGPLPTIAKGAWIVAGVKDIASAVQGAKDAATAKASKEQGCVATTRVTTVAEPMFAFAQKVSAGSLQLGEADEKVFLNLSITAADARTATDLRKIVEGFLALIDLVIDVQKDGKPAIPPEVAAALKDVKVSCVDRTMTVEVAFPVKDVIAVIRAAVEQGKVKVGGAASGPAQLKVEMKVGGGPTPYTPTEN